MMTDLKNFNLAELERYMTALGTQPYRARQIMQWLYQRRVEEISEMTNLSKELRCRLSQVTSISSLRPVRVEQSSDGTRKFLCALSDGTRVESVLIPDDHRRTLCLSTQVGCAMGCRFCLTGTGGFTRNLSTAEILNQLLAVLRELECDRRLTNVVFMGMGEPLANYEAVTRAIDIMTSDLGFGLSRRRVTLSTVGLIPEMVRLIADGVRCRLAVSLNAATQEVRRDIMPISHRYPLGILLDTCRTLPLPARERITFEYVLLGGVNDAEADARELVRILSGLRCKINLIPFNACSGIPFEPPADRVVLRFQNILMEKGYTAIIRESKGADISAACGQLRGQVTQS